MNTNGEQTTIHESDMDLTQWLNAPTGANIVTPAPGSGTPNPGFFKRSNDLSFVNNPEPAAHEEEPENNTGTPAPESGDKRKGAKGPDTGNPDKGSEKTRPAQLNPDQLRELEEIVNPGAAPDTNEHQDGTANQGGRPKSERSLLVGYLKTKIEAGEMAAYDDWDETKTSLDDYLNGFTDKDLNELLDTNISSVKDGTQAAYRKEFFESLPKDLQYAYKMYENGASDLKPIWAALSQVAQVRDLDPAKETDQPEIIRQFLHATSFGSPEEIEAELEMYSNNALLGKKAAQFKPKLDAMSQQLVEQQVRQQEDFNRRQQEAAKAYRDMTYKALQAGKLSEIKLDRKTQEALYNGLTRTQFPSITGDQTNELGYLLEKYQFIEPNMSLISEALWLLRDPEGYRKELMTAGANAKVDQQVRKLKTEQDRKGSGAIQQNFEQDEKPRKLPKVNPGFFKR